MNKLLLLSIALIMCSRLIAMEKERKVSLNTITNQTNSDLAFGVTGGSEQEKAFHFSVPAGKTLTIHKEIPMKVNQYSTIARRHGSKQRINIVDLSTNTKVGEFHISVTPYGVMNVSLTGLTSSFGPQVFTDRDADKIKFQDNCKFDLILKDEEPQTKRLIGSEIDYSCLEV